MIQIDMPMPERCGVCFAKRTDEIGLESWCGIDENARDIYTEEINTKRPDWCPLKEQEAVAPNPVHNSYRWFNCGKCDCSITREDSFCPRCGRLVKWNF